MKRIVPLWIAALGGFVLIVAYFIPATQGWGEEAAIWFDIMAAAAFVLGGGNLLKVHLKKVSNRNKGWGYSVLTVASFVIMLFVGLVKFGAPPAPQGENYGESWAKVPLESVPVTTEIVGTIPEKPHSHLHHSVTRQTTQEGDKIVFRGWIRGAQVIKLTDYDGTLEWGCNVEKLAAAATPGGVLAGRVDYYADHNALAFRGQMSDAQKDALLAFDGADDKWKAAVEKLYAASQVKSSVSADSVPDWVAADALGADELSLDGNTLSITGPMSPGQRDGLMGGVPFARPINGARRDAFIAELESLGPLSDDHKTMLNSTLNGLWQPSQLRVLIDDAGSPTGSSVSACDLRAQQLAGADVLRTTNPPVGDTVTLNEEQVALVDQFAGDPEMGVDDFIAQLQIAGPVAPAQIGVIRTFVGSLPSIGERNKAIAFALMKEENEAGEPLNLNEAQRDFLLDDYRTQVKWRQMAGELFIEAHVVKFGWSGEYRAQGAPFWWLYEYAFKPLQATIFAMLAFYVASAAFRAFRAKNVEAVLLLGTAFIILLGRTFAGAFLTGWFPEFMSGLRIDNLTVTIMQVFNTAGNRAIMIGIALGIASTSLKVLLGVDRSYLGSAED